MVQNPLYLQLHFQLCATAKRSLFIGFNFSVPIQIQNNTAKIAKMRSLEKVMFLSA